MDNNKLGAMRAYAVLAVELGYFPYIFPRSKVFFAPVGKEHSTSRYGALIQFQCSLVEDFYLCFCGLVATLPFLREETVIFSLIFVPVNCISVTA